MLIGVPSAPALGYAGMIMRFVPYARAVISDIPLVLAAAVGTGWSMVLMTAPFRSPRWSSDM